jgi:hypothetical protein
LDADAEADVEAVGCVGTREDGCIGDGGDVFGTVDGYDESRPIGAEGVPLLAGGGASGGGSTRAAVVALGGGSIPGDRAGPAA